MLFVSYARRDRSAVLPLVEALKSRGVDVWIDQSDIPFTADFVVEIERAITTAHAVAFMLSGSSCDSQMCRMELATAEAVGKRIIPVLVGPLEDDRCPDSLRHLNWIPGSGADGAAAAALIEAALSFDHAHLLDHTWLIARAREWEKGGRKGAALLRGQELARAAGWLDSAAGHEPAPTELQSDYIKHSRAAQRTSRLVMGGVATAFAIAMTAGAFFYRDSVRADALRQVAANSEAIEASLDGPDQDGALRAAYDNALVSISATGRIEPAARGALIKSLYRSRELVRWTSEKRVVGMRLEPASGRFVLLHEAGENGFDAGEGYGAIFSATAPEARQALVADRPVSHARLCPSGACVALWSDDSIVVDMTGEGSRLVLPPSRQAITAVDFDSDASLFAVATAAGDVSVLRRDLSPVRRFSTKQPIRDVAVARGGDWVFAIFENDDAVFLDTRTGAMHSIGEVGSGTMSSHVVLPDGPSVLFPGAPGRIMKRDLRSREAEVWATAGVQRLAEISSDPAGKVFAATSDTEGFVYLLDADGERLGAGPVFGGIRPHTAFDVTGDHVLAASEIDSTLRLIAAREAFVPSTIQLPSPAHESAYCTADDSLVWVNEHGEIGRVSLQDTKHAPYWNPGFGEVLGLTCTGKERVLVSFATSGVKLLDPAQQQVIAAWADFEGEALTAVATDDRGGLYAGANGALVQLKPDGSASRLAPLDVGPVSAIAIDRAGDRFAVGSRSPGRIQIGRLSDGSTLAAPFGAHRGQVMGLAFGGNEAPLVSAGAFGGEGRSTLSVWDLAGNRLRGVQAAPTMTTSVAVDPALGVIATSGGDGHVRLWTPDLVEMGYRLQSHSSRPRVVFAKDGRLISTGGEAGARRYDLSDAHLLDLARQRLAMRSDTANR